MKKFAHFNASTTEEAVSFLRSYGKKANIIAGGTDLLGKMKDTILPEYPEAVINIKTIPGLDYVREENGALRIGALAILEDLAHDSMLKEKYTALAQAAHRTASPHLREMGTLGGNICQDVRCWYYRHPENRFPCLRKGGGRCYALEGDNRYHSIFGASVIEGCIAVHPSDTAPALIALDAKCRTTKRTVAMEDFFHVGVSKTTIMDDDEILTDFLIPTPPKNAKSAFLKFALRKSIDFAIVNCAAMISTTDGKVDAARICLNSVAVNPYRALKAENELMGKAITEANAEAAAEAAMYGVKPLRNNAYKAQIAKVLVKRTIMACA